MLLIALGSELSANVMQQLTPDEIERLASGIVVTRRVDSEQRQKVLDECIRSLSEDDAGGGADYAAKLLEQAVGGIKAKEVLGRLTPRGGLDALNWLKDVSALQLASCVGNERPQLVALVVAYLPPEQAAQLLSALPETLRGEVALRLTTMQPTDPEVVKHLSQVLRQRLSTFDSATLTEVGGSESIARILSNVDRTTEKTIMEYLTENDKDVAEKIKENMFVFEDILSLDDRAVQTIVRDTPQEDLRLALKGSPPEARDVFYRNMSQRAADTLKEDLETGGPVKKRDVEGAQGRIAGIARQLDEAGEISIRGTDEEMVE